MTKISIWFAQLDDTQRDFAEALCEALAQAPQVAVESRDVLEDFFHPAGRKTLQAGTSLLQDWLPSLWGALYKSSHQIPALGQLSDAIDRQKLGAYLNDEPADLVVALHPLALLPVALEKQRRGVSIALAVVVPQYHAHSSWWHPAVNHAFVGHPALLEDLQQHGGSAPRLEAIGLPLRRPFWSPLSRREVLHTFQLEDDPQQPIALVCAEDLPREEIAPLLFQLSLLQHPVQWLIDYGEDEELAGLLRKSAERTGVAARMFGKQEHLQAFYTAADLLLCRCRPRRVAEALSCDLPMLLWPPRPGPEGEDASFLEAQGLAVSIQSVEQLGAQLEGLLPKLKALQQAARLQQAPDSTPRLAARLLDLARRKDELLDAEASYLASELEALHARMGTEAPDDPPAPPSESAAQKHLPAAQNPFEAIGQKLWSATAPVRDAASWKEAYTSVLLGEKQLERQFEEVDKRLAQWEDRLDLAERHGEQELLQEAQDQVEQLKGRRGQLREEWQSLQDEKSQLQEKRKGIPSQSAGSRAATPATPSAVRPEPAPAPPTEEKFRALQMEDELARLKQKMRLNKKGLDLSQLKDEDE